MGRSKPGAIGLNRKSGMSRMITGVASMAIVAMSLLAPLTASRAQPSEPFRGKTITIYVGFPAGGGYDSYGRLVARHLGRHIPGNPTVVVSNMPGAQGIACANYLYGVAPKDGTALAVLVQSVAQDQVIGTTAVQYDAAKFTWIGRVAPNVEMLYVWHTVPVKSVGDLSQHETVLAADGTPVVILAELLRTTSGGRFRLIKGYPGTRDAHLAMQRGEVEAAVSSMNTLRTMFPDWVQNRWVNVVVQNALERQADLPDVSTTVELGKSTADRELLAFFAASSAVGRSVVAPPDVPADRADMLRASFDAMVKDEQFLADVRQSRMEFGPLAGADLQRISARIVGIDAAQKERVRGILSRVSN
jgi:tripartite-type tricarboxylate transporter receptor subunit TctC